MGFDAIVVGAGFGGSVCAARLAERGMRVLILERGPWWGPLQRGRSKRDRREFPRGILRARKLLRNLHVARRGRRFELLLNADGLLELHRFDHLDSITASGVGGGSHIYTAILEEPPPQFFDAFPPEITGEEMRPYFERVREIMRPKRVPKPPPRDGAFEDALRAVALPTPEYPDLAIVWGQTDQSRERVVNAAGVEQRASTGQGDVFVGCEDGSKTTLDLTYVPIALRHGAEIRPLCEVLAIGRQNAAYKVRYRDHRTGVRHAESAPRLILAAGGLNTQRLLFDARDRLKTLPTLPGSLGRRFSPNGDFAALLWRSALIEDSSRGPSFGALSRVATDNSHEFLIGDVGLPATAVPLWARLRAHVQQSMFLFYMGRDASTGTIAFDGRGITTTLDRSFDAALYDRIGETVARVASRYQAKRVFSPFLIGKDPMGLFTVHPLGGCSMASTADEGVTDHRGQVFGFPGLFVADGSLYPRSPGIAPSMTIAALAERQSTLMT
jgi:cholesterol oxidase